MKTPATATGVPIRRQKPQDIIEHDDLPPASIAKPVGNTQLFRLITASLVCLLLAGCASTEAPPEARSSTISTPLLTGGYTLHLTPDSQVVVKLIWPEYLGKEIQTVRLPDLNLAKAQIHEMPGGKWATNFGVEIPTREVKNSVAVESWSRNDDSSDIFPPNPDWVHSEKVLRFHSPNRDAARKVVRILKIWQSSPPSQSEN